MNRADGHSPERDEEAYIITGYPTSDDISERRERRGERERERDEERRRERERERDDEEAREEEEEEEQEQDQEQEKQDEEDDEDEGRLPAANSRQSGYFGAGSWGFFFIKFRFLQLAFLLLKRNVLFISTQ